MHCAHSSSPRHQLGCNLPYHNRCQRSTDMFSEPNDFNQIMFVAVAIIIYSVIVVLCTVIIIKTIKKG